MNIKNSVCSFFSKVSVLELQLICISHSFNCFYLQIQQNIIVRFVIRLNVVNSEHKNNNLKYLLKNKCLYICAVIYNAIEKTCLHVHPVIANSVFQSNLLHIKKKTKILCQQMQSEET